MKKKIILVIFILIIIIMFLLIFLFKNSYIINKTNKDLGNSKCESVNTNTIKVVNTNKIVIEYYDLSQQKVSKSVEITDKNEIDTLTNMIKNYEMPPEHIKLHIDGKYVVKISENITISFDSLTNSYIKYESHTFSDIISISPEFKTKIVEYIN